MTINLPKPDGGSGAARPRILVALAIFLFIALALVFIAKREVLYHPVAELEYVDDFQVRLAPSSEAPETLTIKGRVTGGLLAARRLTKHYHSKVLLLKVHVSPAFGHGSSSFQYAVKIPDDVDEIRFGTREALLWQRKAP
jgi:hypothetical protein